jgi:hypothetical protein
MLSGGSFDDLGQIVLITLAFLHTNEGAIETPLPTRATICAPASNLKSTDTHNCLALLRVTDDLTPQELTSEHSADDKKSKQSTKKHFFII